MSLKRCLSREEGGGCPSTCPSAEVGIPERVLRWGAIPQLHRESLPTPPLPPREKMDRHDKKITFAIICERDNYYYPIYKV